jgi:hypothetical protein
MDKLLDSILKELIETGSDAMITLHECKNSGMTFRNWCLDAVTHITSYLPDDQSKIEVLRGQLNNLCRPQDNEIYIEDMGENKC